MENSNHNNENETCHSDGENTSHLDGFVEAAIAENEANAAVEELLLQDRLRLEYLEIARPAALFVLREVATPVKYQLKVDAVQLKEVVQEVWRRQKDVSGGRIFGQLMDDEDVGRFFIFSTVDVPDAAIHGLKVSPVHVFHKADNFNQWVSDLCRYTQAEGVDSILWDLKDRLRHDNLDWPHKWINESY